ncbi:MAG TPA: hypothetical protein VEU31_10390 [Candidatus Acidoferrales bacterium]|nr:hypothetical protein [Candidatus Acidoferrales bacterium]
MPANPDPKPLTGFRNPLVYTSALIAIAALYVSWIFFSRRQESREFEQRAAERKREENRRAVEMMGGDRFEILTFYASPGRIQRGETAELCYGVSNAKSVRLEPQSSPVWPSLARCVEVAPKKDTTYTLTIEDGKGNTKTATLAIEVR